MTTRQGPDRTPPVAPNRTAGALRVPNLKLRELRVNAGMATTDLAWRAGTTAKTIRFAEAGFAPGPRIQYAIAKVFSDGDGQPLKPTDIFPLDVGPSRGLN